MINKIIVLMISLVLLGCSSDSLGINKIADSKQAKNLFERGSTSSSEFDGNDVSKEAKIRHLKEE
ncbi:hypothetical protein [Borrelia miyamotoi]|uniref:hypothetical protein n=1 Tax=Borrelia miyamotoi TaxID=47466 RepID=UPI00087B8D83|nr:hypothetical protein [Borrelia miyamotoi]AOW96230.1 hypothetical protein AXH25_04955 [Borrelia miyamotoi]WAZ96980.1 hypothetical protein O5405_06805 [Borrelia miyamotoi]WAZ98292.1 hypothetical protein O5401_06745 [Borrelia miyamotoi]